MIQESLVISTVSGYLLAFDCADRKVLQDAAGAQSS
jgi:hypothetical protein